VSSWGLLPTRPAVDEVGLLLLESLAERVEGELDVRCGIAGGLVDPRGGAAEVERSQAPQQVVGMEPAWQAATYS
jgi:hypothetical protein